MNTKLKKDEKGFTIIEVLIVLAIAGLIMVIVFLAVPALQRNNRNTQRTNDAARISGAINECLANNNGNLAVCGFGGAQFGNYIDVADNQQLIAGTGAGLASFAYATNTRCDNTGTNPVAGGGARAFTIAFQAETRGAAVNRCIGS